MARLDDQTVIEELKEKHLTLDEESAPYKSLIAPIRVRCVNNHLIETNLKTIRSANFTCPVCVGKATRGFKNEPVSIPKKTGFRIIAFDNSSQYIGVSIFDDGKLVYYGLFSFTEGTAIERISKIRDLLEDRVLKTWQPDFIQFEDVQLQGAQFKTYDVLIKVIGIFEVACVRAGVEYEKTRASVWRAHFSINKKKRSLEKELAIKLVKDMYDIDVNNDTAEAILIGKYRVDKMNFGKLKDLF